jgi:threonine dehydrogenase-like Zn-dependent dehydrogenase
MTSTEIAVCGHHVATPTMRAAGSPPLCPGGKDRMERLMRIVASGRFDPVPLITHRFTLDDIGEAYRVFSNRLDGVLKVAIRP